MKSFGVITKIKQIFELLYDY